MTTSKKIRTTLVCVLGAFVWTAWVDAIQKAHPTHETFTGARAETLRNLIRNENEKLEQREAKRRTAVNGLETELKNLGYDLITTYSNPDEIVFTSSDFAQTDHRVAFLSLLRSRNREAARAVFARSACKL
jgi:hypothetical protein